MALSSQNAQASVTDLVFSGTLSRFPGLKFVYAESQAGWMPYHWEELMILKKQTCIDVDALTATPALMMVPLSLASPRSHKCQGGLPRLTGTMCRCSTRDTSRFLNI